MTDYPYKGFSMDSMVAINYERQSMEPPKTIEPTLEEIYTDLCQVLGVDPTELRADGRSTTDKAIVKKIYCYVCCTLTTKKHQVIADSLNADRSLVPQYKKDVHVYIKIKRPDFLVFWERYIECSKIWRDK